MNKLGRVVCTAALAVGLSPLLSGLGLSGIAHAAGSGCSPSASPCTVIDTGNGQAQPEATLSADCTTGITAVLSDLNGDKDVTFTVAEPSGSTDSVAVRADSVVRRVYAVPDGNTKALTVSAPGMATVSKALPSTCATKVLGEKITKSDPAPTAQLPFTGAPTGWLSLLGCSVLLAGIALQRLGARGSAV